MSNGIYMVGFEAKIPSTSYPPASLDIQITTGAPYTNFFTTNTIIITNTTWMQYNIPVIYETRTPVRLLHTSTNTEAILYIDNVKISDFVERDERMWYAYNALITSTENAREFEPWYVPENDVKTCYLNNSPTFRTPPGTKYTNDLAYVQTPKLRRGIGEISFWYRSWETDGNPPARIIIKASDDWKKAPSLWSNILVINNITNTDYLFFTTNIYEADYRYLRIYCSTSPTYARVCLDNILVAQPVGADFEIPRLRTIPTVPVYSNTVRISCDIDSFLLNPSNIHIRAYYKINTNNWANWSSTNYIELDQVTTGYNYRTFTSTASIPTQAIDTVVQFYLHCTFDGIFSHKASPKKHKAFKNPSWYYPVDLNQRLGATNPYYFVFSCSTGVVWVNEINYKYGVGANTEYVELCGWAGAIVNNWRLELVDVSQNVYGSYPLGISAMPSKTNGYGFWVLGDSGWPYKDAVFTNAQYNSGHLWNPGAVRIVRSMGAYADYVSYGNGGYVIPRAKYIGYKTSPSLDIPLTLVGTGKLVSMFTWSTDAWDYTVGDINYGQTLIPPGESMPYPPIVLEITRLWMLSTNTWISYNLSGGHLPVPSLWYSTNLLRTNWYKIIPAGGTTNSNICTQWFGVPTTQKQHFYRVRATNTPW